MFWVPAAAAGRALLGSFGAAPPGTALKAAAQHMISSAHHGPDSASTRSLSFQRPPSLGLTQPVPPTAVVAVTTISDAAPPAAFLLPSVVPETAEALLGPPQQVREGQPRVELAFTRIVITSWNIKLYLIDLNCTNCEDLDSPCTGHPTTLRPQPSHMLI